MNKKTLSTLALVALGTSASLHALTKVYIFSGQSNMAGTVTYSDLAAYDQDIDDWTRERNGVTRDPVKYHYWLGSDTAASTGWVDIGDNGYGGMEHVAAYRLYHYWKMADPTVDIAIIKVARGATSLVSYWNPGGRDQSPWRYYPTPVIYSEGDGHIKLMERVGDALQDLTDQEIDYEVCGFFWYQGEGDSSSKAGSDNYRQLFEDLVYGWTDRTEWPADINPDSSYNATPQDDMSAYGGSLRELCGLDELPAFVAQINWQTKGSAAWGDRSVWEPYLSKVREALIDYTEDHPNCAWIDVDDIPLHDYYHYEGVEYCEIGDRFVQTYFETVHTDDFPRVQISEPGAFGEVLSSSATINPVGFVYDAAGNPVTNANLTWTSSEDGVFGTNTLTPSLNATQWGDRIISVGSAQEFENAGFSLPDDLTNLASPWDFTTLKAKKITLTYTDSNGHTIVNSRWIHQTTDGDANNLPDTWEDIYWPLGGSGGSSANPDGDQLNNEEEWLLGTDPTVADMFDFNISPTGANAFTLQWSAVANRAYRLLRAPGLPVASHPQVVEIASPSPLKNSVVHVDQTGVSAGEAYFYELQAVQ